jgi:hypothetical protein
MGTWTKQSEAKQHHESSNGIETYTGNLKAGNSSMLSGQLEAEHPLKKEKRWWSAWLCQKREQVRSRGQILKIEIYLNLKHNNSMSHQMGLKLTLAILKQEVHQCLIGTKVSNAYDATVKDDENSAQGTEKDEDLPSEEQTIFSNLKKGSVSSYLLPHANQWNPMHYKLH